MDTMKINPNHLSEINAKEVVFSGDNGDYGSVQSGRDTVVCIAPYAMKLTSFLIRADTLETANGTIDVKKVASGTALSSGTAMVTQVVPTTGGGLVAATNYSMVLHATAANYTVAKGDLVMLMTGSTGELTALAWTAVFDRI